MKAYVFTTAVGLVALDEQGRLVSRRVFRDVEEAVRVLEEMRGGGAPEELIELASSLSSMGYGTVVLESPEAARALSSRGFDVEVDRGSETLRRLRSELPAVLVSEGLVEGVEELRRASREASSILAREAIKGAMEGRERHLIHAVQTLQDLDRIINMASLRVREWYGTHFPELSKMVQKHETYLRLVRELGGRSEYSEEKLVEMGLPKKKARKIAKAASRSVGAEMAEEDMEMVRRLADGALKLYELRRDVEKYVSTLVREVAPNTSTLIGPMVASKLIAAAGGLEKLARLPASTIQVLGAEKALFRALRTGAKPPKHGIIFQLPAIHRAPRRLRGRIARAVAGKIAIAARVDYFSGRLVGEQLADELRKRIQEIRRHG